MYDPEETSGEGRCAIHPFKKRFYWNNRFSDYGADMNVALAYFNCIDDWEDDRNFLRFAQAKALESSYREISAKWPRQCTAIESCLRELADIEKAETSEPDAATNCFGRLMGELFACVDEPLWVDRIRQFGEALGRFIYMMDACVDFEKDLKRGRYNPLVKMGKEGLTEEDKLLILKMLIGDCSRIFEQLPLVQDVDIMRNILYSGVWQQYAAALKKNKEDAQLDK